MHSTGVDQLTVLRITAQSNVDTSLGTYYLGTSTYLR